MPSNLHKMLKAHEGMSLAEKENCNCKKCQRTSVDKFRRVEVKNPVLQ